MPETEILQLHVQTILFLLHVEYITTRLRFFKRAAKGTFIVSISRLAADSYPYRHISIGLVS